MNRLVRRLAWVGVALCVVALAFGVTVRLLGPTPGVTEANFARIRKGMTYAEVEAIMGRSADRGGDGRKLGLPKDFGEWDGAGGGVFVDFGEDGRVQRASWAVDVDAEIGPPSPLARLRSLLGW